MFIKNQLKIILKNMQSLLKNTPKTIGELNQRVWYRSLKVIYFVLFFPAVGFAIFLTYSIVQPSPVEWNDDLNNTAINCNYGNKQTFLFKDMPSEFQSTSWRLIPGYYANKDKIAIQNQCGLSDQQVAQILRDEMMKEENSITNDTNIMHGSSGVTLTSYKIQQWIDNGVTFPEVHNAAMAIDPSYAAGVKRINDYQVAHGLPSGNDPAFISLALHTKYMVSPDPELSPVSDQQASEVAAFDSFCAISQSPLSPRVRNGSNVVHLFDIQRACKTTGGWSAFYLFSVLAVAIVLVVFELGRRAFYYITFGNPFPSR
jgi:hypothetical protein